MSKKSNQKVFIALSGGVDSSVAAALLQKKGYDCTGVYLKLYKGRTSKQGEQYAKEVCKKLAIPFLTYDFQKEFKQKVINYFLEEYKKGKTPNPCIVCNRELKFGLFFDRAMREGADFIATGHYTRVANRSPSALSIVEGLSAFRLLQAKDNSKDQSYFLYRLTQKQLSRTLFPIGEIGSKAEVRKLAKKIKLPTCKRSESQEICFLQGKKVQDFLKKYLKPKKGKIIDTNGTVLGIHNGYFNYTIGQREGLGIGGGTPYYVVKVDLNRNLVIAVKRPQHTALYKDKIQIKKPHWISSKAPKLPFKCQVSIRYNHKPARATLNKAGKNYIIHFTTPQRAPTPGQSAVIYKAKECLGGGVIR